MNMRQIEEKLDFLIMALADSGVLPADTEGKARQLLQQSTAPLFPCRDPLNERIENALTNLGVPSNLSGYIYLRDAVRITISDPDAVRNARALYDRVGECNGLSGSKVERAIRHAVDVFSVRCDLNLMHKFFGSSVNPRTGKPTPAHFIATMARHASKLK